MGPNRLHLSPSYVRDMHLPQNTICCRNVKCEDSLLTEHLDDLMTQVLCALEEAAKRNLLITGCKIWQDDGT